MFGSDDDPVRFAARPEIGSGLALLGWRVYDPAVGRFLSPDPLFQFTNQYSYTHGNPLWFSDADGLHEDGSFGDAVVDVLVPIGVALIVGGIVATVGANWAIVLGIILLLGYLFARSGVVGAPGPRGSVALSGGSGGTFQGGLGPGGGTLCTPLAMSRVPDLGGLLWILLPLQLMIGLLLLRGARRSSIRVRRKARERCAGVNPD